ncbi:MAG: L,D-transpeptidase [Pseudomonadota bacterium]
MIPDIRTLERYLDVSISNQQMTVVNKGNVVRRYPVSTAKNGPGEFSGSECTPRGWHRIRAKIGEGQPLGAVFVGRRATGEVYGKEMRRRVPDRDWILTRILWLGGLEPGFNRYGKVDSAWRYIYIHGGPDESVDGQPRSHGCIRMKNADIVELFGLVLAGDFVFIH